MGEEVKLQKPNSVAEGFKSFCRFLYNPDDHTVFGRGGSSWAKIILFYLVFYGCLAGFFSICLHVMLMTLDDKVPTVTGRTNKPVLAIGDSRLYTINFKKQDAWLDYKTASQELEVLYKKNIADNSTATADFFEWSTTTLGTCGGPNSEWAVNNIETNTRKGCFFMGLNRMYGWAPTTEEDVTHMVYDCQWEAGPTGTGNTNPTALTMTMQPSLEEQIMETYYPWKSIAENGLQPLVAVSIQLNSTEAAKLTTKDLETYVGCYAWYRNVNGTMNKVADARPASFEVEYANRADQ